MLLKKLKTKRLIIKPYTNDELAQLIANEKDEHMKAAYAEMLLGCKQNEDERLWYTAWSISLYMGDAIIGSISFKGKAVNGEVEIGYGINKPYEGNGYAQEAVKAMIQWAFSNAEVYYIMAETELDNAVSQHIITKLKFLPKGSGKEGPRFELQRPSTHYLSTYMCLFLGVGLCFGSAMNNVSMGMCIGVAIGISIGVSLDAADKKKRIKLNILRAERAKASQGD